MSGGNRRVKLELNDWLITNFGCVDSISDNSFLAILDTIPIYNHFPSILGEERELILVSSFSEADKFFASRLFDDFFDDVRVVYRSKGARCRIALLDIFRVAAQRKRSLNPSIRHKIGIVPFIWLRVLKCLQKSLNDLDLFLQRRNRCDIGVSWVSFAL